VGAAQKPTEVVSGLDDLMTPGVEGTYYILLIPMILITT